MSNEIETHDELLERVAELVDEFACGAAGEPLVYALHGPMDVAEEVIEIVRRQAWQEFEAAMLSNEAVDAATEGWSGAWFHASDQSGLIEAALEAALATIAPEEDTDAK